MFDFPLVYSLTNEDETDSMQNMSFNDTMMSGCSAVSISPDDKYAQTLNQQQNHHVS
jgi:hypothetical protein